MSVGHVRVVATGAFLPGEPVPFDDVERVLGSLDRVNRRTSWYLQRMRGTLRDLLGIESYYYALDPRTGQPTETVASMASKAARAALEKAGVEPGEVDLLCFGGAHPDILGCPPTGPLVQEQLGIERCAEMSVHSNCTASYKALQIAHDALRLGRYRTALVTSSQINSALFRADYFNQEVVEENQAILRYFLCDGAGAVLLRADETETPGALYLGNCWIESVGTGQAPHMFTRVRAHDMRPVLAWERGDHHLNQDLRKVTELAPAVFREGLKRMLRDLDLDLRQARFFLANIPNKRFMEQCMEEGQREYGLGRERFWSTLASRGYSGPPAIFISLHDLLEAHTLRTGDLLVSFVTESSKWINAGFVMRRA